MLSSDILESQFGPTQIGRLYQDNTNRIIKTVNADGKVLELSWVTFDLDGKEEFPEVHARVTEGMSMGKAFRDAGLSFDRASRAIGQIVLPPSHNREFGSNQPATVTETDIFVGPEETFYCHILETFSPEVAWPEPVESLLPPSQAKIYDFANFLDAVAVH